VKLSTSFPDPAPLQIQRHLHLIQASQKVFALSQMKRIVVLAAEQAHTGQSIVVLLLSRTKMASGFH
jgi:hypothetical protein